MATATAPHEIAAYDAIVIGSGIGGLTAASLLTQLWNKRVLVLERHYTLGGYTHTFKRPGGYHWDVGVHYIGGVAPGRPLRRMFDLISRSGIQWHPMPEAFDAFVYPDFTFVQRAGRDNFIADLIAQWPQEEAAIRQYFVDLRTVDTWAQRVYYPQGLMPRALAWLMKWRYRTQGKLALTTVRDYMRTRFKDPKLRAVLCSQWGDYGVPPAKAPMVVHAAIVNHYLWGGYYPVGSSKTIADSIVPIIEAGGGAALVNHPVSRILIDESGAATGVEVVAKKSDREIVKHFTAPLIISTAGVHTTYQKLIPQDFPIPFRNELARQYNNMSCVTLYLGFNLSPESLGFRGENHWIYEGYDHDETVSRMAEVLEGRVGGCYLSFPSLKDPEATAHTGEIIAFVPYDAFAQWKDGKWKKRGEDYEALKERIAQSLLDYIESKYPGFRSLVAFHELSTPLSVEHFTDHHQGGIYGLPSTNARLQAEWLRCQTPVKNLYIAGSDLISMGVGGAMMGSVIAMGHIFGTQALRKVQQAAAQIRYDKE
jgi:phytoene dehydrogenase-like protein